MSSWDPQLYRRYEDERTRPAAELLARVSSNATRIVDLGCGPGNSTGLLVRRFPAAAIVGIDNSAAMLQSAAKRLPQTPFESGDIAVWEARYPPRADGRRLLAFPRSFVVAQRGP